MEVVPENANDGGRSVPPSVKNLLRFLAGVCLPGPRFTARMLYSIAWLRVHSLRGTAAARFILELDALLYPLTGWGAVQHGEGVHPKHRLTNYHGFFVDRLSEGDWVLDVGCGNGCLALDMAQLSGARVTGVDISSGSIAEARATRQTPRVDYVCGDVTESVPEGSYTVAVLSNVLEHIEDRPGLLRSLRDNTAIQRFLIRVPCFERDWRVPVKKELGIDYRLDSTHFIEHTLEEFLEETGEAGLKVIDVTLKWGEIWAELSARDAATGPSRD
jgi:SAM-dependent methyltransferase